MCSEKAPSQENVLPEEKEPTQTTSDSDHLTSSMMAMVYDPSLVLMDLEEDTEDKEYYFY